MPPIRRSDIRNPILQRTSEHAHGEPRKVNQGWNAAIPAILKQLIRMNRMDDRFPDRISQRLMDRKKTGMAEPCGQGPDEYANQGDSEPCA